MMGSRIIVITYHVGCGMSADVYHEAKETFQREAGKLVHNHTLFCIYFFSVIGNGLKERHGSKESQ